MSRLSKAEIRTVGGRSCDCGAQIGPRNQSGKCKSCILRAAPRKSIELTAGQKFGRLTVIRAARTAPDGHRMWRFLCECGSEKEIAGSTVSRGVTVSCGCYGRALTTESLRRRSTVHGHNPARLRREGGTPTHRTWASMLSRCRNPKHISWPKYGGAGITVCERWLEFANFLEDMGIRPSGTSIDRIDATRGYEPGNCRWATPTEQQLNTRVAIHYMIDGEVFSQNRAAEKLGISRWQLRKHGHPRAALVNR